MKLCGLFKHPGLCNSQMFVTFEVEKPNRGAPAGTPTTSKIMVLLREASSLVATSIPLQETRGSIVASFAPLPSGNVLCALCGFESVYELQRASCGEFLALAKHPLVGARAWAKLGLKNWVG